ncbi:MAG TPA: hypothetical protein VHK26_12755 [Methyloceanibacter sp.]|nr:hypothetical protein [Methyloceanibacter sp.]
MAQEPDWEKLLRGCPLDALLKEVKRRRLRFAGRPRDPETIITDVKAYHFLTKMMQQRGLGMRASAQTLAARTGVSSKTLANKYMKVKRIVGAESDESYRNSLRTKKVTR